MSTAPPSLHVHPDRLLPPEPHLRPIARRLYDAVRHLPIISPHGHVDAGVLAEDQPFHDPASLLVSPDHYVTRLLHAQGVPLAELGVGAGRLDEAAGPPGLAPPVHPLVGLPRHPGALLAAVPAARHVRRHPATVRGDGRRDLRRRRPASARGRLPPPGALPAVRDRGARDHRRPGCGPRRPRGAAGRPAVERAGDPDLPARPPPGAGPAGLGPGREGARRGGADRHRGLRRLPRRARGAAGHFIEQGATSADHSHLDVRAEPLEAREAARIYAASLGGTATPAEAVAFRRHMLMEMARMSVEDGLVMTLHPAVRRNHHAPDLGPVRARTPGTTSRSAAEFTRALQPLLERYGTHPNLQLVLFTTDEAVFSRELAPLAGFYPRCSSARRGGSWTRPTRSAASARRSPRRPGSPGRRGSSTTPGRSAPSRSATTCPVASTAGWLARLVADHRLEEDEALETITELVAVTPRRAFRL